MAALNLPEYYADLAQTTLSSSYTAGSGSIVVTSATALNAGSGQQFHFMITDQTTGAVKCIGKATALVSSTFTVVMTTDANAASGDFVTVTLCAAAENQIISDSNQLLTFANLPATVPSAGKRVKQTDGPYEWVSDGSAWKAFYQGFPCTLPPASGWTADNLGVNGSITYTHGYGYATSGNSDSINMHYRAAPGSTPYSFTAKVRVDGSGLISRLALGLSANTTNAGFAFGFRDSSGKYLVFLANSYTGASTGANFYVFYATAANGSFTPLVSVTSLSILAQLWAGTFFYKFQNDGTNLNFYISIDGNDWQLFYSETITTHLSAATNVCWGSECSSQAGSVMLLDWTQGI